MSERASMATSLPAVSNSSKCMNSKHWPPPSTSAWMVHPEGPSGTKAWKATVDSCSPPPPPPQPESPPRIARCPAAAAKSTTQPARRRLRADVDDLFAIVALSSPKGSPFWKDECGDQFAGAVTLNPITPRAGPQADVYLVGLDRECGCCKKGDRNRGRSRRWILDPRRRYRPETEQ
jgi:hypothetical protein